MQLFAETADDAESEIAIFSWIEAFRKTDTVVIDGQLLLKPGIAVKIQPRTPAEKPAA